MQHTPSRSISANCREHRNSNNVSEPKMAPRNTPSVFRQFLTWDNTPGKSFIQCKLK